MFENHLMIVFNILCYWSRVSPWPICGNKMTLFFCLFVCQSLSGHSYVLSTLFFCRLSHFLISNSPCKGLNLWLSLRTRHGHSLCSKIVSKIECNNAFSIMHWIVSDSSLVINDLFVIFGENPIEILILNKATRYVNY